MPRYRDFGQVDVREHSIDVSHVTLGAAHRECAVIVASGLGLELGALGVVVAANTRGVQAWG